MTHRHYVPLMSASLWEKSAPILPRKQQTSFSLTIITRTSPKQSVSHAPHTIISVKDLPTILPQKQFFFPYFLYHLHWAFHFRLQQSILFSPNSLWILRHQQYLLLNQ